VSDLSADELARAIVARLPRVPLDAQLWDEAQCADYLGRQSVRTFERTQAMSGFPAPVYVPGKCWIAADVIEWARMQKAKVPRARRAA